MLLTVYFFIIGVVCITNLLRPFVAPLIPASFPNAKYHLVLIEGDEDKKESLIDFKFDRIDLVDLGLAAVIGVWYLLKKHWIANNIFGLAFSLTGVEALHLNRFVFIFITKLGKTNLIRIEVIYACRTLLPFLIF